MLLEVTLSKNDEDFGSAGQKILLNFSYVVGIGYKKSGCILHLNLSDTNKFKSIHVTEDYSNWFIMKLNP
jgi:hypothetical protein